MENGNGQTLPMTPDSMNALVNALGALTMALSDVLTAEQKERFADNLARIARAAEKSGDTATETLLIDLQRAARA